jgi:heme A synthase
MQQRFVITAAAWLEIVVGTLLVVRPDLPCLLLFASKPDAVGMALGRFSGVALVSLGIAFLPWTDARSPRSVAGLFAFNVGVAILLVWLGIATSPHGLLLWPAVVLHTTIAAALLPLLRTKNSVPHP